MKVELSGPDPVADELLRRVREIVPPTHGLFVIVGELKLNAEGARNVAAASRNIGSEELITLLESFAARIRDEKAGLYG